MGVGPEIRQKLDFRVFMRPCRNMEQAGPGLLKHLSLDECIFKGDASGKKIGAIKANTHGEIWSGFIPDTLQDLTDKPCPLLSATPIFIRAAVGVGRKETTHQIPVSGMKFYHIIPC